MPRSAAFLRIWSTGPSRVRSHTPRRSSTSAACRTRSSVPSGRTTRRRSERACSSSLCSNIIGVTRSLLGAETRPSSSAVSTYRSKRPSAVSALRGVAAFNFPSREKSSAAVGKLLPATDDHRGAGRETGGEGEDLVAGPLVQGEQHAGYRRGAGAVRGEGADDEVRAVARGDDQAARRQGVEEVRQHRAAEDEVQRVAGEPRVVAEQHLAAEGVGDLGDRGRGERGLVRQRRNRARGARESRAARRSRRGPRGRPG